MANLYKKINLKLGNKLFRNINKNLKNFYKGFETLANLSTKNSIYFPEIKKMNHIMEKYVKAPGLKLSVSDNLIPFKFETEDGVTLSGIKYITNPKSNKWLVGLHWFAGHKYWSLYAASPFIELGYNIMTFDFRNHGESEDFEYITMGLNESKDFKAAMKWLNVNHAPETIGLLGMSMGGFVLNYAINVYAEEFKNYNIKFGITDSFYGSISTLLSHTRNVWLKDFIRQKKAKKVITSVINSQTDDTGVDWNNIDVFKYYDQGNLPYIFPMFYMHARNDKTTPFDDSLRAFIKRSVHSRDDEILIYDVSKHCMALKYHYKQTIYRWIKFENKIMKNNELTNKALEKFGLTKDIVDRDFDEQIEINTLYLNSSEMK